MEWADKTDEVAYRKVLANSGVAFRLGTGKSRMGEKVSRKRNKQMIPESNCSIRRCKYYRGVRILSLKTCIYPPARAYFSDEKEVKEIHYCKGFLDGIPDDISYGDNEHKEPAEGQMNSAVFATGMDPRLVKPYRTRDMENHRLHGQDNLCSTIRDIYTKSTDEEVRFWCRLAMRMSKNMYKALEEYKRILAGMGAPVRYDSRDDWQLGKK